MTDLSVELVENTFKHKFDDLHYREFLTELFNKSIPEGKNQRVPNGYDNYINSAYFYDIYGDSDRNRIGLYSIELKKSSSIDRARTMQRNLIAHYLKENVFDCALVAFYEPNSPDWRFSFVKTDYEFNEKGNLKPKLSPAKRHSFLVGENEPNQTCRREFVNLLSQNEIFVHEIEAAFNVENVTKEFFDKYRELFHDLTDSLDKIVENNNDVAHEFEVKNIKTSDFAKKLMGQLVFLYFLQKKGWLGVPENGSWGDGPKDFMRRLYNKEFIEYNDNKFFDDVIEPLFYQGLSEDVHDYHYSQFNCKIPFLNGGLFENLNDYDWENTDLIIEDKIFGEIFDTFDTFNFTVKEDEPLEKEVAVDPEMLGKVFENLLEVTDRKSTGAFYTPRYIVHYICQQTLINYLETNTEDIPKDDIAQFIENGHLALDSIVQAQEEAKKYNGKIFTKINLGNKIKENASLLDDLLLNVKVVDPAVGSGAFPVGMMNEIVKSRQILLLYQGIDVNLYDIKRETIENSLYGVDLSLSATDITKLRFWLSLVVDEESMDKIRPLPNLDNHILCGNSIIDGFEGVKLFDENLIKKSDAQTSLLMKQSEIEFKKLEKLKSQFFNEKSPNDKKRLRNEINEIKWKFVEESLKELGEIDKLKKINEFRSKEPKPFFIWELEFSEVFKGEKPGFDIVIGNPPYVDIKELDMETSKYIFKHYKTASNRINLYSTFVEKGFDLLKDNGAFGYIIPNSILFNSSYKKIRLLLLKDTFLRNILRVSDNVFSDADVEPIILIYEKNPKYIGKTNIILKDNNYNSYYQNFINQKEWINDDLSIIMIYATEKTMGLLNKIENSNIKLKEICEFNLGLTPYDKAKGMSKKDIENRIYHSTYKKDHTFKELLDGGDINRYNIKWGGKEYISYGPWLGAPRKQKFFTEPRIIIRQILSGKPKRIYAGYTSEELYNAQIGFNLIIKDNNTKFNLKYLLGIINSKLMTWYHEEKYIDRKKTTYAKILIENAKKLPIVLDSSKNEILTNNVEKIINKNNKLQELSISFRNSWNIGKISTRNSLYEYWYLSENDFIKKLNIKRKSLGMQEIKNEEKNELIIHFNQQKEKICDIKSEIDKIDNNIDKIVYEIYELNPAEIKIIDDYF